MNDLSAQATVDNTDPDFVNGKITDLQTIVGEGINQDIVQFFQGLIDFVSLAISNQPDNQTNGYDTLTALEAFVRAITANTSLPGTSARATNSEVQGGTNTTKHVTPAGLESKTATETRLGIVEKATTAEAQSGVADKFLAAALLQLVTATTTRLGIVEKATTAEAQSGVADKFLDAALLQAIVGGELTKIIQIGDWDMDVNDQVSVAHGLTDFKKIRSISAMIRNNADTIYYEFITTDSSISANRSLITANSTNINLARADAGFFDNSVFSGGSFNRGWITIKYVI
jgi:hypothetical protein